MSFDFDAALDRVARRAVRVLIRSRGRSATAATLQRWLQSATGRLPQPRTLFDRLPRAVFRRIFIELPLVDRVVCSRVCRDFDRLIVSDPLLWSEVSMTLWRVSDPDWPCSFRRSESLPLKLCLLLRARPGHIGHIPLADVLPRLTRLEITYTHGNLLEASDFLSRILFDVLSQPAPRLTSLQLSPPGDWRSSARYQIDLRTDFLGGQPACLEALFIGNSTLGEGISTCPALSGLTEFVYWTRIEENLHAQQLADIIISLPRLQKIGVAANSFTDDLRPDVPCPLLGRPVQLGYVAGDRDAASPLQIFLLDAVGVTELRLWSSDILPVLHSVASLTVGMRRADVQGRRQSTALCVRIPVSPRRLSSRRDTLAALSRDQALFSSLTSLCIHECMWTLLAPLPPAPRLTVLAVILSSCCDYRSRDSDVCGVLQAGLEAAWPCDALREVHFIAPTAETGRCLDLRPYPSCSCAPGYTISLAELGQFVATALRFEASRLRIITVSEIQHIADVDLAGALRSLREVAEHLEFSPVRSPLANGVLPNRPWIDFVQQSFLNKAKTATTLNIP